jgi:hypothetical protein
MPVLPVRNGHDVVGGVPLSLSPGDQPASFLTRALRIFFHTEYLGSISQAAVGSIKHLRHTQSLPPEPPGAGFGKPV